VTLAGVAVTLSASLQDVPSLNLADTLDIRDEVFSVYPLSDQEDSEIISRPIHGHISPLYHTPVILPTINTVDSLDNDSPLK
jgi:hypothetical protein